MHSAHDFLVNLALVLCTAAIATVIFQRLRQPVVLGYILAGLVVGPHVPVPLVADLGVVETLAELGVILLMFALGLEFRLARLAAVAPTGGIVAIIEVSLMASFGYLVGSAFGWTQLECLFTGAIVSISSTSIIAKAFEEQNVSTKRRDVVFGVLIAEDLLAILMMVGLSILASGQALTAGQLGVASLRLAVFLAGAIGLGLLVVPRAFRAIHELGRPETTTVAAVGLCFAAALASQTIGYSAALGAFLGGMLVAESGHSPEIEHLVRPVRDVFAALFFVSVGMLIDPALVVANLGAVVVLCALVLVGKVVAVSTGAFLVGNSTRSSIRAGMSLAQIGEFSFILAALGASMGATRDFLYPVAIAVSAITAFTTPLFVRNADRVANRVDHKLPARLQTLTSLYGAWIEELRTAAPSEGRRSRIRGSLQLLLLDALVLAALIVAHSLFGYDVASALEPHVGSVAGWIVTGTALFVSVPLLVGLVRASGSLARVLAEPFASRATARRMVLVTVLHVAVLLLVGLPLVAVTQPFLPPLRGVLVLATVQLSLAFLVWRRASDMQSELRSGVGELLFAVRPVDVEAPAPTPPPASLQLTDGHAAVGHTLIELNLRSITGATVIAITRSDGRTDVPTGREALEVGDVVHLAGPSAAVRAARVILADGYEPETGEVPRELVEPAS